jgi:hypothetical protein
VIGMNDEQTQDFLYLMRDIRDALRDKQVIKEIVKEIKPERYEQLQRFKDCVISNVFWSSLTKEQREQLIKL